MTPNFIPNPKFDEYREILADHFVLDRDDRGVVVARMHSDGGPAVWNLELHRAFGQMFAYVGNDRDNELLILTATGDNWLLDINGESFAGIEESFDQFRRESFFAWYQDGLKMQENLLWSVEIPTISAVNGPGHHTEVALLCDMTICTPHTKFLEAHYSVGLAPGDALFLVLQELIGVKRATYAMYQAQNIPAEQALEWGLVNEVVAADDLLDRAHQLADVVLAQDPIMRRITTQIVRRPWHKLMTEDFRMHFAHEMWATLVHPKAHSEFDTKGLLERE